MKKYWIAISAAAIFVVASAASAQAPPPATDSSTVQTTETKHTEAGKSMKTKRMSMVGSVKSFDAGKKLVVTGPKNKDYSFDLDDKNMSATIDPAVAVGGKVKVMQKTDDAGMKTLTVAPFTGGMRHHHHKTPPTTATPDTAPPPSTN